MRQADDRPLPQPRRRRSSRLPVRPGRHRQAGSRCQTIPGGAADTAVGKLLLDTLTPLTLEVALTVQGEIEARAADADAMRASHVERARHRADLARRRYLAVDPGNRLVAGSLEADWNDALRALQAAQDDYDNAAAAAAGLTDADRARIRALATDFPALWSDPATPQRERKRMARLLIDDVTMTKTDRIHLHVRFRGGQTTSLAIPIPPTAWQLRQTRTDALAALDRLLDDHTDAETAAALNAAGHRSGEGKPFTGRIVLELRRSHNLPSHADRLRGRGLLTLPEIADRLGVHVSTIKAWRRAGLLTAHRANDKNIPLFDPPDPADPRLVKRQGSKLARRVPPQQHQEVQYEAHVLSQHWPVRPCDSSTSKSAARSANAADVYWQPLSLWKITPGPGSRAATALASASATRLVRR